jgi:hypothetical protein
MAVKNEISPDEVTRRTAIVRQFRELLKAQRDRFGAYLDVLEKQKDVIEKGSAESLLRHVELGEKIVEDIFSIQKVINPLEELYRGTRQNPAVPGIFGTIVMVPDENEENDEVKDLKKALEDLKTEAVSRSKQNRALLSTRMAELRVEMKTLRANPYLSRSSRQEQGTPSLIDIRG